jgi:hypothetical protein
VEVLDRRGVGLIMLRNRRIDTDEGRYPSGDGRLPALKRIAMLRS